tara:strand:- start:1606 stop:1773 length:168 start_codon:yes stop_codon:yes gene_type:complete
MTCHPFFTGETKFVDTAGRVEKFARRYGGTQAKRASKQEEAQAEVSEEVPAEVEA